MSVFLRRKSYCKVQLKQADTLLQRQFSRLSTITMDRRWVKYSRCIHCGKLPVFASNFNQGSILLWSLHRKGFWIWRIKQSLFSSLSLNLYIVSHRENVCILIILLLSHKSMYFWALWASQDEFPIPSHNRKTMK